MKKNGKGGAKTKTGLIFEERISLKKAFEKVRGYEVNDKNEVYFEEEKVAEMYPKYDLYNKFLEKKGIDWKENLSKRLIPDEAIFVLQHNTLYIIEKKFQKTSGSVDEKLQTCDFKRKQYIKLVSEANIRVEYYYVLNDWFKKDKYQDVLNYIQSMGCRYFIEELPLSALGLPTPD